MWRCHLISLGYRPRNQMVESYGKFTINLLRSHQTIFRSGCVMLHSYQQFAYHILTNICYYYFKIAILFL
jgi:hypothetical protein